MLNGRADMVAVEFQNDLSGYKSSSLVAIGKRMKSNERMN
jgi:hypothetical protein